MRRKKIYLKTLKNIAEKFIKTDANSTSCLFVYQPKAPSELKKYSKIENSK